jgi:hypothetical protein
MKRAEYLRMIRTNFDPILLPHGFSCEGSKRCAYWRKISDDIFHIISPDALRRMERYDINVFATSPFIHEEFFDLIPDGLPYTNGGFGYLSPEEGVGRYQKLYFCANPDAFIRSFRRDTIPALVNFALPYLEKIKTMEDLIPTIRGDSMLGAALVHVGKLAEARPFIENTIKQLTTQPRDKFGKTHLALEFQMDLLKKATG